VELFETTDTAADLVFVGDSLTAAGLWDEWLEGYQVINRGISGETTSQLNERIGQITEFSPATVCLMSGINDLADGVAAEEVATNYESIVRTLLHAGCRVVVQSTLFTCNEKASLRAPQIERINHHMRKFCRENGAEYLDLTASLCHGQRLRKEFTTDGVHLNASGYAAWTELVTNYLSSPIPK
jgi:lysophospholipase L1-like esterase